jgi:hypothetical protein
VQKNFCLICLHRLSIWLYQREAKLPVKVTYLDQNHWIKLSQAAYGRGGRPETATVLEALRQARASGRACFPLSWGHYLETTKRRDSDQRHRLARFMLELSDGMTIAPPPTVWRHEIAVALGRCFPGRVVPEPFELLGRGAAHAAEDGSFDIPMEWPPGAEAIPAPLRAVVEGSLRAVAEFSFLCGVSQVGAPLDIWPVASLTVPQRFETALGAWAGAASRYSPAELRREIYYTNLTDIVSPLQEALAQHEISIDEFMGLGELRWWAFLEDMPWQRADMHLKRQWAKNANLRPNDRSSHLSDWAFLSVAVSYCDIVVTEKLMADLYSRGFDTRAKVITQLSQLPALVA